MEEDRETILRYLPEGWEEAAKSEGALQRSRKIKTAEDLLYLVLLYLTGAGSFQNASTLMRLSTDIQLNKEAVRKRIMGCWKWLRWMGHRLSLKQGYVIEKPEWIGDRRVLLVDATDMALRGSSTSDYRLHYAFDLYEYSCAQAELTGIAQGEKLSRYGLRSGDIVVADRIYGTISGMEHARQAGADYLLRLKTDAFALYDEAGKRIDLLAHLRALQPWEALSLNASTGTVRVCRTRCASWRRAKMTPQRKERTGGCPEWRTASSGTSPSPKLRRWLGISSWRPAFPIRPLGFWNCTVHAGRSSRCSAG